MELLTKLLQFQFVIVSLSYYIIEILQQGTQDCLTSDLREEWAVHKLLAMPHGVYVTHPVKKGNLP